MQTNREYLSMNIRIFSTDAYCPIDNDEAIGWMEIEKHEYGQHCYVSFHFFPSAESDEQDIPAEMPGLLFPTVSLRNQAETVSNNEKGNITTIGKVVAVNVLRSDKSSTLHYDATEEKLILVGTRNAGVY